MQINPYIFGALIAALLGQTALLRHWVKFRRRECEKCLEDMKRVHGWEKGQRPEAQTLGVPRRPSFMDPPASPKIQ